MNPSFAIRAAEIETTAGHLLIEAGPAGISFVILDRNKCFAAVVVYAFPFDMNASAMAQQLEEIVQAEPLLQQQFKKTDIAWTFPQAILVPNEWMNTEAAGDMLDLVYGDLNSGNVKSDFMFRHNLHTIYRIPEAVANVMANHFLYASQTHQYSLLPDLLKNEGNQLYVIFYNNRLTAMLHKEGKLQVIQNLSYQNPEDAAYHLLNVCQRFEVAVDSVVVKLSGMIDIQSNLYAALYKYFLHIGFEALPGDVLYNEAINDHPPHFFSHLFAMALCV